MPKELTERDVSFGPFKTRHHARTVDQRFRESFILFVRDHVLPFVEGAFHKVEGKVTSYYDDTKYFGPLSAVRFRYFYEIHFHSPDGSETAKGELDYDPAAATFRESRRIPPHVDSLSLQRKRKGMMEKVMEITTRYRAGERELTCPYCGLLLSIWYLEERNFIKDIRCPSKDCLAVHFD